MNTYEYKALDLSGKKQRGLIEADSRKDARERLVKQKLFPETIQPTRRSLRFKKEHRAVFYRELGALLQSGMPAFQALELIMNGRGDPALQRVAAAARDCVREGRSVGTAVSLSAGEISGFEAALLSAGEHSGALAPLLEQLADYLDREQEARKRMETAMVYPLVVFAAALIVAVVMLGALLPRTSTLLGQVEEIPALTRLMIAAGNVMLWGIPLLFLLTVAAVLTGKRYLIRNPAAIKRLHSALLCLPLLGRILRPLAIERFAGTMALLRRADIELVESVVFAGAATGNVSIANAADEAAEKIRNGQPAGMAVRGIDIIGSDVAAVLEVGQAGGDLCPMLQACAQRARREWENAAQQLLTLVEPLLILFVGLFVLLVSLAVLLPVFSMSSRLGSG